MLLSECSPSIFSPVSDSTYAQLPFGRKTCSVKNATVRAASARYRAASPGSIDAVIIRAARDHSQTNRPWDQVYLFRLTSFAPELSKQVKMPPFRVSTAFHQNGSRSETTCSRYDVR